MIFSLFVKDVFILRFFFLHRLIVCVAGGKKYDLSSLLFPLGPQTIQIKPSSFSLNQLRAENCTYTFFIDEKQLFSGTKPLKLGWK